MSINKFIGIIFFSFSSKYTYKIAPGVILKEGYSFVYDKILVKTKKIDCKKDMYATLHIEKQEGDKIFCNVIDYLGFVDDMNGIERIFCTTLWKTSKHILTCDLDKDLTPNRVDYTNYVTYSIDPIGCKDIDDALHYIYDKQEQIHEIGIHIADPSSYIPENSPLDIELSQRVETIYVNEGAPIYMIPDNITKNMSLIEGEIRRGFSVIIRLNEQYDIISTRFEKTLIRVTKNLSYEKAECMLPNDIILQKLYQIGSTFNKSGVYDIHQMIAVYMICANRLVSEAIRAYDHDRVLLRVHQGLKSDSRDKLVQKHNLLCAERALYQIGDSNCNHSSLGLESYTHFTSPIRRYADILVHRQLWGVINRLGIGEYDVSLINFYRRYYRRVSHYAQIVKLSGTINNYVETDGHIILISDEGAKLKIYIGAYDIICNYVIVSDKMKEIFECETLGDSVNVRNKQTDGVTKLTLFQLVRVKLIIVKTPIYRYILELVEVQF